MWGPPDGEGSPGGGAGGSRRHGVHELGDVDEQLSWAPETIGTTGATDGDKTEAGLDGMGRRETGGEGTGADGGEGLVTLSSSIRTKRRRESVKPH